MELMLPRLFYFNQIPEHQSFFLFGPRGSGKSTLIRSYLEKQPWQLTYDLLRNQDQLRLLQKPWLIRSEIEDLLKKNPVRHTAGAY